MIDKRKFEIVIVTTESGSTRCLYMIDGVILVNDYDEGTDDSDFMFARVAEFEQTTIDTVGVLSESDFRSKYNISKEVDPLM